MKIMHKSGNKATTTTTIVTDPVAAIKLTSKTNSVEFRWELYELLDLTEQLSENHGGTL